MFKFIVLYLIAEVFVRIVVLCFFFFKQKTAYVMRISDWSSDVCSSDLARRDTVRRRLHAGDAMAEIDNAPPPAAARPEPTARSLQQAGPLAWAEHVAALLPLKGRQQKPALVGDLGDPDHTVNSGECPRLADRGGRWMRAEPPCVTLHLNAQPQGSAMLFLALSTPAPTEPSRSEERRVGKSVSVRVALGGRRLIKNTKQ